MAAKKILMIVGDYVEDYEVMVPFQMLTMVGHEVHAVCPGKAQGETVKTAIHDFEGDQTYSEKPGHNFMLTYAFDKVNPDDYVGLVIPGGRAPEYLRLSPEVLALVKAFDDAKKPIAAICHGMQLLTPVLDMKGRKGMCYPAVKPELETIGGIWVSQNETFTDAHVDGNLVTAAAWPAHPEWMRKFLELVGTKIEA
ncbi:MAG: DJ-1/PfpI family protein [Desulfovibrio sp.]|uniref:DJ-1/PfpI family protein n=1 Tax=Desulfovibrio sp. 7SRBS1 TaxID=3378064 RepID=UPI003B406D73